MIEVNQYHGDQNRQAPLVAYCNIDFGLQVSFEDNALICDVEHIHHDRYCSRQKISKVVLLLELLLVDRVEVLGVLEGELCIFLRPSKKSPRLLNQSIHISAQIKNYNRS